MKKENPSDLAAHCIIHSQELAVKSERPVLEEVMCNVMEIVSYIKSSASNSRLFISLCGDIDSEHRSVVCSNQMAFRGNVLERVFQLKTEIEMFLDNEGHISARKQISKIYFHSVLFSRHIFAHIMR
ncbi:protein FAM200A-like [Palaemon carinicauda]|uniref:protein FAM200A-like n=1 Tax=Palaemon carinicauda TaxID=392227 RepID=UPI0035B64488